MESNNQHIVLRVYTNFCRFVLAAVFLFSGFVKANDPLGFCYKLGDYLLAFGLSSNIPESFPMFVSIVVATLEFMLGVYLLFGINRRFTSWTLASWMFFMTLLTLYLAIANPISDCGCFGDAIVLSNWETFWKNVFILIAAFSVLRWKHLMFRFITHRSEWLISLYSLSFILLVSYFCLQYLPIFDFRPYHIGANIPEQMVVPEGKNNPAYESVFVMEKEGERKEFTMDNYPDSTWKFIDKKVILKEDGYIPPAKDFSLTRLSDGEDITEEVLASSKYTFLMIAPYLEKADDGDVDLINELYEYSSRRGYLFYCVTASQKYQLSVWKDKTGAEYPFCSMDDITLKTIVRANPGIVLLKDGVVINKWSHRELPNEYQLTDALENLPIGHLQSKGMARKIGNVLAWFIFPLLGIFALDRLYCGINNLRRTKK